MKKSKKTKESISKKMTFAEVMRKYPETAEVFFKHGMTCFGCPAAMQETLEAGILAHGKNVDEVIKELNSIAIKKK